MQGTITTRHLLTMAPTITHEFGITAYLHCWAMVLCHRRVTFLECVCHLRGDK